MDVRHEIKKNIPRGSAGEIAEMANVTPYAVSRWLNGHTSDSKKIEDAVAIVLAREIKKKKEKAQRFESILNGEV